ncbi:MAG: hypothetical protein ACI4HI_12515 [Lachnospiraceae bacterium]
MLKKNAYKTEYMHSLDSTTVCITELTDRSSLQVLEYTMDSCYNQPITSRLSDLNLNLLPVTLHYDTTLQTGELAVFFKKKNGYLDFERCIIDGFEYYLYHLYTCTQQFRELKDAYQKALDSTGGQPPESEKDIDLSLKNSADVLRELLDESPQKTFLSIISRDERLIALNNTAANDPKIRQILDQLKDCCYQWIQRFHILDSIDESEGVPATSVFSEAQKEFHKMKRFHHGKSITFRQVLMRRFYQETDLLEDLLQVYQSLETYLTEQYTQPLILAEDVSFAAQKTQYFVGGFLAESVSLSDFLNKILNPGSLFSMLFEDLSIAVRPSDAFLMAYKNRYPKDALSLNLCLAPPLTKLGTTMEEIRTVFNEILCQTADAYLIFAALDTDPGTFSNALTALNQIQRRFETCPLLFCFDRIENQLLQYFQTALLSENGTSTFTGKDVASHVNAAYAKLEETTRKQDTPQWFSTCLVTTSSTIYHLLQLTTKKKLELPSPDGILDLIVALTYQADKPYLETDRSDFSLCSYSIHPGFVRPIAEKLTHRNIKQAKQFIRYLPHAKYNPTFLEDSIDTYLVYHQKGSGYTASDNPYFNFNLHIRDMIRGELNDLDLPEMFVTSNQPLFQFSSNAEKPVSEEMQQQFENLCRTFLKLDFPNQINPFTKKISYDFLNAKFLNCYCGRSRQDGFFENMKLFSGTFTNQTYWEKALTLLFSDSCRRILFRLGFYGKTKDQ